MTRLLAVVSGGLFAVFDGAWHLDREFSPGDYFELRQVRERSVELM